MRNTKNILEQTCFLAQQAVKEFFTQFFWIPASLFIFASLGLVAPLFVLAADHGNGHLPLILLSFSLLVGIIAVFIIFGIVTENRRLQNSYSMFHNISHIIRKRIAIVSTRSTTSDDLGLAQAQQDANNVCQLTARLFTNLIGCECDVSVNLVTRDKTNVQYTFVWARSGFLPETDEEYPKFRRLDEQPMFIESTQTFKPNKYIFHSPNLNAGKSMYRTDPLWQNYYNSVILVPMFRQSESTPELLGFLKLQTMRSNRLNDTFHVQIIAAIADQLAALLTVSKSPVQRIIMANNEFPTI